ncbi:MAG: CdaR family protein, partial [Bacillota bacterium]
LSSRPMDDQHPLLGVHGDDFANQHPVIKPSQVLVSGTRGRLDLIAKITGDVDLTGASDEIKRTVPVRAVDAHGLDMPDITIRPNSVDVTVSVVALPPGQVVSVKGKVTGDPAPGYHLVSVTVDPVVVKLRGDMTKMSGVDSVTFEPFSVAGAKGIVSHDAEIILPPGATMAEPRTVRVTVDIEEDGADKTISGIPMSIGGLASGLTGRLSPTTLSVTVRGPKTQLAGLAAKDIAASVNATGLKAGTYNLVPDVTVPNGFTVVTKDPATVTVTIK